MAKQVFAEIIYETGAKSVACYDNEEEMVEALKAHHLRAVNGEVGGPPGHTAERIKEVQLYSKHPNDLNQDQVVSTEVAKSELEAALKELDENGAVSVLELAAKIRDLSSPLVLDAKPHDSMYKMPADKVITEGWEVTNAA